MAVLGEVWGESYWAPLLEVYKFENKIRQAILEAMMVEQGKPAYAELLQALREAPPWQSLGDERYRRWYVGVVMPLLERVPEPK